MPSEATRAGRSGPSLMGRPVTLRGIRLGVTVDLLLDTTLEQALGFEVAGLAPGTFLPFGACAIQEDGSIEVETALPLLVSGESSYYGERSVSLRRLESVRDVTLDRHGRVTEVELRGVSGGEEAGIGSAEPRIPQPLRQNSMFTSPETG
jgi:hypothetical protein